MYARDEYLTPLKSTAELPSTSLEPGFNFTPEVIFLQEKGEKVLKLFHSVHELTLLDSANTYFALCKHGPLERFWEVSPGGTTMVLWHLHATQILSCYQGKNDLHYVLNGIFSQSACRLLCNSKSPEHWALPPCLPSSLLPMAPYQMG